MYKATLRFALLAGSARHAFLERSIICSDRLQTSTSTAAANALLRKRAQTPFGGPPRDPFAKCLNPASAQGLSETAGTRQRWPETSVSALQAGGHRFDPVRSIAISSERRPSRLAL